MEMRQAQINRNQNYARVTKGPNMRGFPKYTVGYFWVTDQEGASHGGTKVILHFPWNFAEKIGFYQILHVQKLWEECIIEKGIFLLPEEEEEEES